MEFSFSFSDSLGCYNPEKQLTVLHNESSCFLTWQILGLILETLMGQKDGKSLGTAGKPGLVKYVALIFVDDSHDL
jgi:hypothetical protein